MRLSDIERDTLKRAVLDSGIDKEFAQARIRSIKGDRSDLTRLEGIYPPELLQVARNLDSSNYQRFKRVFDRTNEYVKAGEGVFLTLTFKDDALKATSQTRRVNVSRTLRDLSCEYVGNIDFGTETEREHYHALVRLNGLQLKNKFVPTFDREGNRLFKENGKPLLHKEGFYFDQSSKSWKEISSLPSLARWKDLYGFVVAKVVASSENDARASSKYVGKNLSLHALKSSTSKEGKLQAPRLIYSRRKKMKV